MKDILYGMAIGDALGVPYEFKSRDEISKNPCTTMIGNGSHQQPIGTWSDDTSLSLATVESLSRGYNINDIANNFVKWRYKNEFTCNSEVFDIGNTTSIAIHNIKENILPVTLCGGYEEKNNSNGSLMRILPIVDYLIYLESKTYLNNHIEEKIISDISSITHRDMKSIECCKILINFAKELYITKDKVKTYNNIFEHLWLPYYDEFILKTDIKSGGYVLDTLEASIWCLLTTDNYKDAVLKAVNLGKDTDTTACVTGGLAGILYGYGGIPKEWIKVLKNKELINDIINSYELSKSFNT